MTKIIQKYLDYLRYEKNYSLHTEISYSKDLSQFCQFLEDNFESLPLEGVDSDMIRQWIAQLVESGLSTRSVNRKLSSLKSFYRYLCRVNLISSNPLARITGPKSKRSLPSFVNDRDMEKLLEEEISGSGFEAIRNRVILELFYVTGMRRAELMGLKNQDVDLLANTIRVNGKRNKQRIIPVSDDTRIFLEHYIKIRDEEIDKVCDAFFVRENGMPLYAMLIYRVITSYLKNIPTLDKASPHVLRHSFATEMLNNGAEINAVKELLGHSSLASTEVYTHTSFEELKNTYKKAHPRA